MRKLILGFASLACLLPAVAWALGLGEINVESALNQPLKAYINLVSATEGDVEDMDVSLAGKDAFQQVGIDRPHYLSQLKFKPMMRDGKPVIMITTDKPVREPFYDFLLQVRWSKGQLVREYTILLDPPTLMKKEAVATQPPTVSAPAAKPAPVPAPAPKIKTAPLPAAEQPAPKPAPAMQAKTEPTPAPEPKPAPKPAAQPKPPVTAQAPAPAPAMVKEPTPAPAPPPAAAAPAQPQPQVLTGLFPRIPLDKNGNAIGAPGEEMPASEGGNVKTKRGDTLWKLAAKLRPSDNVSVQQMMIAMLHANPKAFDRGNINSLKRGYVLRVPTQNEIAKVSQKQAITEVKAQNSLWRAYSEKLAGKAVVPEQSAEASAAASAEKVAPAEPEAPTKTASAGAEKKLQIMGAETKAGQPVTVAGGSDVADLQKQAAQAKEALESQKQKNAELQSRIDELQGLLQKKERLINLQSDQLSELQKSVSEKQKESAEQPPAAAPEKPVTGQVGTTSGEPPSAEAGTEKPSAPAPEAPAAEKPAPAPAETPAPSETPATSESPAAQTEPNKTPESPEPPKTEASSSPASKPAEPQSVPKPKVTPPPEQPGFFDSILSNPTMMMGAGGGLLLVLALVWLVIRRSGQRRAAAAAGTPSFAEPDIDDDVAIPDELESLTPADVAEAEGEPEPEPQASKAIEDELEHTTVMPPPGGAAAEEITNDEVMNEADVYLAYGLTDQAVDMLKDAISKHPERNDYRLKLLEAYYNAKDKANFDTTARALNDSLGGAKGQIWDRAVAMGKEISPESALFSGETTSLSVDDFTAKKPEAADIELGGEEEFEPPTSGGGFEGEFDLPDIGGEPSLDEGDDQTVALEPEFEPESDTGLDMPDLGALGNEPAQAEESYEQPATETDINELEFDLGDLDLPSEEPTLTGQEPESDTTGLDFDVNDLDISGDELSELEAAPEAGSGSDTASNEDALDIEMDNLDMGEDFGVDSDTATVEMPAGEEDSLTEEVGTKLDLAKAYIDMGDEDGARGALEEVLAEGNDAQKREAQDLMSQIA